MASQLRRYLASCLTTLALPAQFAHACINITQEPPRPDIVESFDTVQALFDSDNSALPIAVGQRIEIRLPVFAQGERWQASIATGLPSSGLSLEQTPASLDQDGIRRQGVVLKGIAPGDTMVLLEHISAAPAGKDKKKAAEKARARAVKMVYLQVEELQTRVTPTQPHPLILTAEDAGKPWHVTNNEDIVVTLALPNQQDGKWRIAASTAAAASSSYATLIRTSARINPETTPADRFVLNSMALTGPLTFEFIPAVPAAAKTISFDIKVYPAPVC